MTKRISIILLLISVLSVTIYSCRKKKLSKAMFEETNSSSLSFYNNKDTIYEPKGGSPHGYFKLKFNQTALNALGADGKLPVGGVFPNGSLIVKEVYSNNVKTLYAVMKKDSKSKYASNKWLWAEFELDGKAKIDINREGKDCVSCHTSGSTRDLTRSFDLH